MKAESLYIQKLTYDENTGNEIIGLFPSEANPAIVSSYTYDAKRMGGAPTLTATIYSSEPLQWKKEEFVEYNGDRFFASYTPNSTKDNSSRMWKSEITFTSRRELLDNTLFFDVVVDDVDTQNKDRYRSNQTKFTFGGTINEFVARVNSSMAYCGLYRPTDKYKGYYVVVDEGYGTDEVKEVSFEDQYLTDVLQLVNTTFELDYYWDGNVCHVGKVQHDLTDTPIKYGSSDALISVSKENANYKIVDMITGYGSSDNLPYYYPNDDEFGEAVFNTENISKDKVSVELSKFLKDSRYNDTLILYKSKDGKNYNGSVDVSSKTFDRFTTPSNLTQADSQSNPTVTCIFSFDILISAIKGQTIDLTSLGFDFELNSSVSRKDYITKVGNAVKSIYLFKGKELYKTISKRMSIGSTSTYTFEEDGDFTLSIESEFSYKCKVYKNSAGINDFYGADSWNAAFSGSVEFLYESKSEYEWKNGDKYIPYSDAGINVSVISEANCIEYDYQFVKEGDRYGFNKVYTGTDDNATKVVVTDRVWIAPSSVLMPSIYRNTKGAERFYYALNNTHKLPSGNGYYEFVNLYKKGNPHQGTVTFDGIKPTINGIVNAEGQLFGEIADVAFDKEDSDVKDSDGNYIHSYFYIKLHKFNGDFGFDLFAHALASEPAKINLIKSNGCPACSFVIYNKPSADNSKYYNCVSVDENGNLKQVRTDKNDYIFANASDAYEDNLNQDSTQKELWIAVQKDTSTLGIVMPNASAGFKPQKGDLFVITGIKPPKVLVTAAEKRLDDALVKHMSENNTDQFNYSVKFSRIFLQENPDFASKLNENAKLSIQIQGDYDNDGNLISHKVFVSNYSVKVDNDELAEVEIELVNSLEVTKSDTKQIIDAVKGEAVKSLSSMVGGSNTNSFNASITDKMYLSKLNEDTAKGTITWEKIQKLLSGLLVGNFNSENGGSWTPDTEGRSHLITDYLEVRMKAIFEELVVKKTSTIGGKEIISPAGGVVAHKVEEVTVTYNNVSQKAYRCYFLAEQEGDSVDNDFAIGDQVRSESFNVRKGTYHKVGNHFYWRLVIGRDEEPVELEGKKYHYIDLSDTDCATASDVPAKGDVLNQCGNRTDVDRQNCLIFSAVDTYSPSVSLYHGINSYSFANKEYVEYGVNKQTNKAFFNVYGDMYVGDRPTKENGYEGSSYIKYDSAAKQVSVKGKISAKSTVDGKELSQYIKENSAGGLTEEQVNNLIKNSQVIADLQNQVDGAIETWFYDGVPTLKNAPASSWTTDKDKDTHLGDLYYDNKTGKAYRFAKDGNTYKWTIITDTDIAKALSDASKAQETADGKMKVFSAQPIPPYQLGDIWVNATYPTDGSIYKNEILRCQTAKVKGSSFAIADWTKASKYTDDSALNSFKEEYKNDMASYKEQLDEKVETWFYNYAPTTQNKPASDWTTDTLKSQHAGDLFYNTSNGYTYRWTGTAWARIKDNDINTAMTAASKAQDTADGKRTVFTSQPTVPYDEGDLWASGGDDGKTLMVCIKGRTTGSFTSSEWVKANDSDLNAFAKTIEESLNGIRDQLDKKAETWYQPSDPSASWTTDDAKKEHKGDLWYNTSNNQTFFWNGTKWDKQDVPTEVFDKIDGKSSIYVSKPASYEERDLWILEAAYTLGGVAYSKGELVVATKSNASFSAADWTKKVKYTDDTVANAAKKAAEEAKKAADTAQTNVTNLGKTVTSNKKAFDNYVTDGYLEPSEIAAMAQDSKRLEDAFAAAEKSYIEVKEAAVLKDTKELTDLNTAFATLTTAKTELVTYLSDISARYNKADTNGKATIVSAVGTKFTNFQGAYSAFYDKLGLANAYITRKIYGDLGVVIGDVTSLAYLKKALMDTPDTEINGGLILTSLIGLRDTGGNTTAGINGITEKSAKGGGVAAWFGGEMVDKDYNDGSKTPANTIFRFDGSGYVAGGAIWWGTDGRVHADPTSFIISEKNLGAYLTFFEPTWKSGSAGTSVADLVSLKPNAPFSKLGVSGDATFEGAITFHGIKLTYDATNKAIKIDGNLYATGGITAYGAGTSTSTGGGLNGSVKSYSDALKLTSESLSEVASAYSIKALSRRIDNIATELGGLSLSWDNITGKPSTFAPSAHTHKWAEITDRITKVSQLTNDSGYTKNTGTVTSVSLTLPAGLTCATKTITTSGTFAISLASGYSIPTTAKQTAWDGAVSAKHTHSNKSVLDGISSTKVSHWNSAYDWYALMTTDEETADGIINKWNEVVSFLANIAQTDTLSGIVDGINKSISDEVARAKKAEGVNASGISANKGSIATLQGYFTNGSAKKALQLTNARKLWGNSFNGTADINGSIIVPSGKYISIGNIKLEYDAANKALKITNTTTEEVANLYTSGGVSAYGVGASSSTGGGLNGSVKSYADALKLTSESLSEVASAYSIKALDSRISSLEGGSATSIETTGSGNAVTSVSKSGTKITFTKGSTFSLNGHTHTFASLTSKPTSLSGYGITDGVNAVSVTGSGNAITTASISGHTLTLTKGSSFSLSSHTHGLLHTDFVKIIDDTSTDNGWTMINDTYKGFILKSLRTQANAPSWVVNNFAAGIAFGGSDTKGVLSVAYSGANVGFKIAGGNGTKPVWWMQFHGTSGENYNMDNFSVKSHTHYVGTTRVQGSSAEQALTGITKIDNILKLSKATVTVNTSYKAEQNRLVIYGTTYGNDANYIKSAGKLSYGDGGPQLVFSTSENPDASGVQSAALVYTDHDTIGVGASLSFVTNQGEGYFIAPHIKALTAFQGNLAWSYITNKPTTLSGFGITDGLRSVTHSSGSNVFVTGISTSGTAITYTKSYTKKSLSVVGTSGWTNASIDGNIIPDMSFIAHWNGAYSGTNSNLAYCNKGAFGSFAIKNSLAFSELTSKPTTISGYGITDAYTKSQVDAIAAKYLPLTGGTLTGQLRIAASALNGAYNGLLIGDDCYIGDCNTSNTIGLMGVDNNNAGMVKFGKGGMKFGYNGSNHIASTTAQWTNLNADLLDGWHKDNIVWSGAVNSNTASLSHYWAKLFDITVTDNQNNDRSFTFLFSNGYNDTYSVVVLRIRQNGAKDSGAYNFSISLRELVGNMSSRLRVYYNNATGNVQLWGNCQVQYGSLSYTIIKKTGRASADFTSQGTLVTNSSFSAAQSLPATTGDSPYTLLDGATRIGIVKQADQLVTARSLWGQSFNGTANVSGNMTGVGNINTSAAPAGTIYTNNWFRSKGSTGWYSQDHGGGWYMSDNTWIRNFGGKDVFLSNKLSVNGNVGIGTTAPSHKLHVSGEIYTTTKVNINGIILEKDSNGDLKVNGNLYATGGISAYGTSSAGSGGGLNGSVKSYSDALKLTSESLSEIASAYSIKALASRISSLEGGSATSISVSGSGNAVTSVTKNGTTITVTKGATFLTAHQSLSAYMKTADAKSLFLYHTRENIVTDLDNFNTSGASHIYEMTDVTNTPTDNGWLQVMNWGSADANYGMLLANDYYINGSLYFRHKVAGKWKAWKTLIDSSNIANQSVKYATTAGTAKNPNALSWSGYASGSYDGSVAKSISIPNNTNQLTNGAGFITASASITGNAATATKLQTARTIWGQSFNGTANVSGSITGVNNITMSNNSYLYGKNTGGTAIQLIAMASWNSVDIGRGALTYGYTTQVMGKTVALTASDDSGKNTKSVELSTAKLYSNVNIETEGGLLAHGGVTAYSSSDIRLKQDLRKLDYLGIIKAMGGTFSFAWKKDNTRSIGWIAQHVLCNPHLKDIVETDEKGYYKINYWSPKLIATAFGAIEQVGDEVSRLKARVVFLESEVQRLSGKQDGNNKKRLDNKNINLLN